MYMNVLPVCGHYRGISRTLTIPKIKAGQNWNQDRRAEHREHVLEAQDEHSARTELSCIIDAFFGNFLFTHFVISFLFSVLQMAAPQEPKKKEL